MNPIIVFSSPRSEARARLPRSYPFAPDQSTLFSAREKGNIFLSLILANTGGSPFTMERLDEIDGIKRLKYRYLRCLDTKRWDELAETFTENATAAYDSGRYSYNGRDAIMEFLRGALGDEKVVSMHHAHHPEIELLDSTRARGRWYLEDMVIFTSASLVIRGAAFYDDRYVKVGNRWLIDHTGYERTFEEMLPRGEVQSFRSMFEKKA
jgi:hypothetical protein